MKWEITRLGDIANFSNGINFDKSAYTKGVMLIGVSNFGDRFYPDYSELSQVKEDIVRESDYLKDGDIVFVRSNGNKELVGRCMLIKNPPTAITYSGFCIRARLKDTSNYDPVFFTYHFKGIDFRRAMSGTAVGANIQNLSQARLSNYTALIPDIKTQQHMIAIIGSSVLFGAFHLFGGNIIQMVMTACLGVFFCVCRLKVKNCSTLSLIIAHGVYDAMITVFASILL